MNDMEIKRIINGKTYNTATAALICKINNNGYQWLFDNKKDNAFLRLHGGQANEFDYHKTYLYQTRNGAFFVAGYGDQLSLWGIVGRYMQQGVIPLTREETFHLLELESRTDELEELMGECEEASDNDAEATVFSLRLPPSLKSKAARIAERDGLSLNSMLIRCIERCCDAS